MLPVCVYKINNDCAGINEHGKTMHSGTIIVPKPIRQTRIIIFQYFLNRSRYRMSDTYIILRFLGYCRAAAPSSSSLP